MPPMYATTVVRQATGQTSALPRVAGRQAAISVASRGTWLVNAIMRKSQKGEAPREKAGAGDAEPKEAGGFVPQLSWCATTAGGWDIQRGYAHLLELL